MLISHLKIRKINRLWKMIRLHVSLWPYTHPNHVAKIITINIYWQLIDTLVDADYNVTNQFDSKFLKFLPYSAHNKTCFRAQDDQQIAWTVKALVWSSIIWTSLFSVRPSMKTPDVILFPSFCSTELVNVSR